VRGGERERETEVALEPKKLLTCHSNPPVVARKSSGVAASRGRRTKRGPALTC